MKKKLKLNPNIFFLLKDGKIIVWDYLNHNQYELDKETFAQIVSASEGNVEETEVQELIEAGLITDNPYVFEWGWDELSKIYHLGCKNIGGDDRITPEQFVLEVKEKDSKLSIEENPCLYIDGEKIMLPQPSFESLEHVNLWSLMQKRMTSRCFSGESISLQTMTNIIYSGFGRTHNNWEELEQADLSQKGIYRKAHPSGGGLHPLECYLIVENVTGLKKGIYYYNWYEHYLVKIDNTLEYDLPYYFYDQFYCKDIALGVIICNRYSKVWGKYSHSRGYGDVNLDVGHASQSMLLMSTLENVLTWETAWFRDKSLSKLLGLNKERISPSFFIGLGYGEKKAIPEDFIKINKRGIK